VNNYSDR
jgi:transposase